MARKEFTYKGLREEDLKKLSAKEFAEIANARVRRTIRRGFSASQKVALEKMKKGKEPKTHERGLVILPEMIGKTIKIHNGKEFKALQVTAEMVGHFVGEFSLTRNRVAHSAPGVGATRSSANVSVK